jgi:hypothetical protein
VEGGVEVSKRRRVDQTNQPRTSAEGTASFICHALGAKG